MFGVFGATLAEAKGTEFFQWFRLEEVTRREDEGGHTKVTFRPSGRQFHDLVAVEMTVDGQEHIAQTALAIRRSFIDDSTQSMFAADITKSFLLASLDREDVDVLIEAIRQIASYRPASSTMKTFYLHGDAPEEPAPGEGEPAYFVYAGKRRSLDRALNAAKVSMLNEPVDGSEHLTITVAPK
jgi:hypothetical protein